jgi:hypothetical protein
MQTVKDVAKALPVRVGATQTRQPTQPAEQMPRQRDRQSDAGEAANRPDTVSGHDVTAEKSADREQTVGDTVVLSPVSEPVRADNRPAPASSPQLRATRQATFDIIRVSPRSVFRLALAVGAVLFVLWMIGLVAVYLALAATGTWNKLNSTLDDLLKGSGESWNAISLGDFLTVGGGLVWRAPCCSPGSSPPA